jgi:hypothetical protein
MDILADSFKRVSGSACGVVASIKIKASKRLVNYWAQSGKKARPVDPEKLSSSPQRRKYRKGSQRKSKRYANSTYLPSPPTG